MPNPRVLDNVHATFPLKKTASLSGELNFDESRSSAAAAGMTSYQATLHSRESRIPMGGW